MWRGGGGCKQDQIHMNMSPLGKMETIYEMFGICQPLTSHNLLIFPNKHQHVLSYHI